MDLVARYRSGDDAEKDAIVRELFERKAYSILKKLRTAERKNGGGLVLRRAALQC